MTGVLCVQNSTWMVCHHTLLDGLKKDSKGRFFGTIRTTTSIHLVSHQA